MAELSHKRIAKNSIMLSIRMVFTTLVGLYTSRIVLEYLGIENYGIFGVVGGIVSLMTFLNSSMAGATSRFITYAMGKEDSQGVRETFSACMLVHIVLGVVIVLAAETIGLWILNYKLNIPDGRMFAANWVFQCSVLGCFVGVTQVPYSACIIANEKMGVYAYFTIIGTVLKLLIVYLLTISPFDKLIFYSTLYLATGIIMIVINRIYCIRKFPEAHMIWRWDKKRTTPMLKFAGWDIYGNMSASICGQGRTFLINIFYGVTYNAAVGIADTINGTLWGFSGTIGTAFKPQITKQYAGGDIPTMAKLMTNSLRFTILITAIVGIPFLFETEWVLQLWLGQIPDHSSVFLKLIMVGGLVGCVVYRCNTAIHATGNIKRLSFINGSVYLLSPLFIWAAFKLGGSVYWAYYVQIVLLTVLIASVSKMIHDQIPGFPVGYMLRSITVCYLIIIMAVIPLFVIHHVMNDGFWRFVVISLCNGCIIGGLSWVIILSPDSRKQAKTMILNALSSFIPAIGKRNFS